VVQAGVQQQAMVGAVAAALAGLMAVAEVRRLLLVVLLLPAAGVGAAGMRHTITAMANQPLLVRQHKAQHLSSSSRRPKKRR
jgi:hypothetical protein